MLSHPPLRGSLIVWKACLRKPSASTLTLRQNENIEQSLFPSPQSLAFCVFSLSDKQSYITLKATKMRLSQWQTSLLLCLASLLPRPLFAASSAATSLPTCTPQNSIPIHYPIRNVTLSDSTLRRGAAVSFGTPGQPFACLINPSVSF